MTDSAPATNAAQSSESRGISLRSLLRNKAATAAVVYILIVALAAALAPVLPLVSPDKQNLRARFVAPMSQAPAAAGHPLGTDQLGRDILSRLVNGARVSLSVGFLVVLIAAVFGSALGLLAGYLGGRVETLIMRVTDVFLAFPFLLLAVVFMATLGPSLKNVVLVLSLTGWVEYARVVRAQVLSLRNIEYVKAAESLGAQAPRLMAKHILPNIVGPTIVIASLHVGSVIIAEASLTFLGLGVPPSVPTWGMMLATGRDYLAVAWWLSTLPGVAIVLTVLSLNFLGDWLRDAIDPTLGRS